MKDMILLGGVEHKEVPKDMEKTLSGDELLLEKWNSLTPLARNEWICWVTIVKQESTREKHIVRMSEELLTGKKRPCCWPGCPHHNPKAAKFFNTL